MTTTLDALPGELTVQELIDHLDGRPFYLDPVLEDAAAPRRLLNLLQAEGTMLVAARALEASKLDDGDVPPIIFQFWALQKMLEGELPVPKHMLSSAAMAERGVGVNDITDETRASVADEINYLIYGTCRYWDRFPERVSRDPERVMEYRRKFDELVATGYAVLEIDDLLARCAD